jgi:hypothetical protein
MTKSFGARPVSTSNAQPSNVTIGILAKSLRYPSRIASPPPGLKAEARGRGAPCGPGAKGPEKHQGSVSLPPFGMSSPDGNFLHGPVTDYSTFVSFIPDCLLDFLDCYQVAVSCAYYTNFDRFCPLM